MTINHKTFIIYFPEWDVNAMFNHAACARVFSSASATSSPCRWLACAMSLNMRIAKSSACTTRWAHWYVRYATFATLHSTNILKNAWIGISYKYTWHEIHDNRLGQAFQRPRHRRRRSNINVNAAPTTAIILWQWWPNTSSGTQCFVVRVGARRSILSFFLFMRHLAGNFNINDDPFSLYRPNNYCHLMWFNRCQRRPIGTKC